MLSSAGRSMIEGARAAHARQFAWSRMPSLRELRRRAEVPAGTKEPSALTAMLGSLAPDVWDENTTDIVDIYLSAGPRENQGASDYRSCAPFNTINCSLHHLRFSLKSKKLIAWKQVDPAISGGFSCMEENGSPGYYGTTEPALSPTSGHVAATRRCHQANGDAMFASIQVWDRKDSPGPAAYAGADADTPQYGNWLTDDFVIFNTSADHQSSVSSVGTWPDFSMLAGAVLGPDAGGTKSFQDPNVSYNAVDAFGTEERIVTFGGSVGDLIPRVTGVLGQREHPFNLPKTVDGDDFRECHHPAWRPDGHEILCTRYQSAEKMAEAETGCEVRRLYGFTYDGTGMWDDPTALVEVLSREDFNSLFVDADGNVLELFPPRSGKAPETNTCLGYAWKYAEWCGSNRYLIATVFCSDNAPGAPNTQVLASRVVLIDLAADTSTKTAYTDLTVFVEIQMGVKAGSYDAVFATCGAVPDVEDL